MQVKIRRVEKDFPIVELDSETWNSAEEISIEKYWSGETAPVGRHANTKLLWSETALYIRFEANQTEPLIISEKPNLKTKTRELWNRDVCEIFVAPDKNDPQKYFEFEIAPTGEWIDLRICKLPNGERKTDFDYDSGMKSAAKIEKDKILLAVKVEWEALGKTPKTNDVWRGNLFRCVGSGDTRGYLAWQPTKTEKPNFHVPKAFGEFKFGN
jgi:alpha-galactosidase